MWQQVLYGKYTVYIRYTEINKKKGNSHCGVDHCYGCVMEFDFNDKSFDKKRF